MDILTITGLFFAVMAIVGGTLAKGAGLGALWNFAAMLIVVLGTIGAILVQTPLASMKRALQIFPWAIRPPTYDLDGLIEKLVAWSQTARRQGLLGLEPFIEAEQDAFLKKGLQLLVDGGEPDMIRSILEVEMSTREDTDIKGAKVYEGMGIYAPTLGIIGAVLGLMAVMQNLADPSTLGPGIAAAFVATIYGIGLANLFFLPMANKLKGVVDKQSRVREMVVEGLIAIAEGENPRNIEVRLQGYMD